MIKSFYRAFDSIELRPKNKLNLIIGANGSGKSTFVCAIVLGLGGKPNIIGRSPNVSCDDLFAYVTNYITISQLTFKYLLNLNVQ